MPPSIIERIAFGDAGAVRECIDQYGAFVWSLARRLSPTSSDAEDATQEIFVKIWHRAGRFDASLGSEKTFIALIARHRLIDRLRKAAGEPLTESSAELLEAATETDPSHSLEKRQQCERALRALEGLRPEQRQVLELGCLRGFTHAEIAHELELPLGTVKSLMRRGLRRIRDHLTDDIPAPASAPRSGVVTFAVKSALSCQAVVAAGTLPASSSGRSASSTYVASESRSMPRPASRTMWA